MITYSLEWTTSGPLSTAMIIWMLKKCVLMNHFVLYYHLDYQKNEGGARLTHNGPFHGPRLHVCINTQKSLKWVSDCCSCFSFHTPPSKHFWNLFPSPNLMAREHKGWKQNLQSIPKVKCGTLSRVSWNCQAGMNRTALSGLYLPHRNSCRELDMKQLTVSFCG